MSTFTLLQNKTVYSDIIGNSKYSLDFLKNSVFNYLNVHEDNEPFKSLQEKTHTYKHILHIL